MNKTIKIYDIFYLAGLLEGEGCFGFYNCPTISLNMTDYEPVNKARNIMYTKCNIRINRRSRKNPNRKDMYVMQVSGQLAIEWMMTMYPLMSPRRKEKIREIIIKWKEVGINNRAHNLSRANKDKKYKTYFGLRLT